MHIFRHAAFRWLISFVLLVLMGYQLWSKSNHFESFDSVSLSKSGWWILIVIFLMPVNWWLESIKWKTFLDIHLPASMKSIFKAVSGGIALSLFTPNRIGEYGGRILFMPSHAKWPVAISTFMGSISQNLVVLTMGIISGIFILEGFIFLKVCGVLLVVAGGLCYFQMKRILQLFSKLKVHSLVGKLMQRLHYFDDYSFLILSRAAGLAFCRYTVYVLQFVLLLHAFEPGISAGVLILGVSTIFLFQTLVPLPPVADVLARTNIGLIFWAGAGMSELSISLASLMVWLINLLIPALIGSIFIGTTNTKKTLDTDDPHVPSALRPVAAE